jgi:hypothetical protein
MTEETTSMEPIKAESYEVTRFNALRHGVLSHYTVLPWEDADEYRALVAALGRARAAGTDRGAPDRGTGRNPVWEPPFNI